MIKIQNLQKSFGRLEVLKGIDLEVQNGKALAILGPNGSGKTTLIKCLLALVIPDSGEIFVDEINQSEGPELRKQIGYMPQVSHFPDNLKALDIIKLVSLIREEHFDIDELVAYFELGPHMKKPIKELSGGTVQKLSAMLAFLPKTSCVILDEPTVGLDPISRIKLKDLIQREKNEGKTILFTSHIMSDVEEVADEIAFMLDGEIKYQGSPAAMIEEMAEPNLERAIAKYLQIKE